MKPYIIYGMHAVDAAIKNPKRKILEIYSSKENSSKIKTLIKDIPIQILERDHFKKLIPTSSFQNIAALVEPIRTYQIPKNASKLIILDKITDPQNLGSILRSSAAFGIDGVIYPKDGSAPESGASAKAASGALDIVPLIEATNLNKVIAQLKKDGFWIIGLDGSAKEYIGQNRKLLDGKIAFILGSEGKGLRDLVKKNCDLLVKIPINPQMESLNVSIAASIAMYEMSDDIKETQSS